MKWFPRRKSFNSVQTIGSEWIRFSKLGVFPHAFLFQENHGWLCGSFKRLGKKKFSNWLYISELLHFRFQLLTWNSPQVLEKHILMCWSEIFVPKIFRRYAKPWQAKCSNIQLPILYSILYFLFNYEFDIQLLFNFRRVVLYSTRYLIFSYVTNIQPSLKPVACFPPRLHRCGKYGRKPT